MLETKGLVKIYKPKKGVPVRALDGVTLKFPDTGMVFLLGKSGSGKSTLLNVLGGLDRYDDGEIRIKGVSSKKFKQSHFDSYRNTYVGFIFQEYNVLEDFTVGANIALALQLQGKKATDEAIDQILRQVDLDGYGNRKPNELSGGQKQRVAIARALVKSPEIIMADEPTGALDSTTGRQVLETLKRLSKEKLVIVVSHDQEFAETYADRIIELADGKVVQDVERTGASLPEREPSGLKYEENVITVPHGYHLTEEDRIAINEYLNGQTGETLLRGGKAERLTGFTPTNQDRIRQSGGTFQPIKSRLPFRFAFPMGASGLKHKKIRLAFTILLSCIAFGLFGLADTFASYDHVRTTTRSLIDSNIRYASVEKTVTVTVEEGDYTYRTSGELNAEDLDAIRQATGVELTGVYRAPDGYPELSEQIGDTEEGLSIYSDRAAGYLEITEETLSHMGGRLIEGTLPDGEKDEIALSTFLCQRFLENGYKETDEAETVKISSYRDMIGKTLTLNEICFTVCGIVDTGLDLERYENLKKLYDPTEDLSDADRLILYALSQEFEYATRNSLAGTIMVGKGKTEQLRNRFPSYTEIPGGTWPLYTQNADLELWLYPWSIGTLSENRHLDILWLDGTPRTELAENEIVLPVSTFVNNLTTEKPQLYNPIFLAESENPDYSSILNLRLRQNRSQYNEATGTMEEILLGEYQIVGLIQNLTDSQEFILFCDSYVDENAEKSGGLWDHAIGTMPQSYGEIEALVSYCNRDHDGISYGLLNPVSYELDVAHEILQILSKVFLWIGVGFAVFAALLLSNFIGTSISYKKQEIGILRAIGSRGNDVFRIFFSESFLIALINFVLSAVGTFSVTLIINHVIRTQTGLLITLLSFGLRQVVLLFLVSVLIAAVASFIPVKKIAAKRPIDAIRDR
ncbi:MAG: ABC transporter ATP-binding protein/permease [Clostridia bacterium]|nr:ABC transporter ATP-binding protein/permease [Clostridia bacterium]